MTQNIAHSIRQRLLNLSRHTSQDYNRLLVRYSLERFLYRVGQSGHASRFILKGAMLFAVWADQQYRATQDLDLLGTGSNSPDDLVEVFQAIIENSEPVPDGMLYHAESITVGIIREDMAYEGVRVQIDSRLGNARIPLTIDIGFGDAITPAPVLQPFPVLLDHPIPMIRMYPRETVIAEKLEAMVSHGEHNSRMKDFADVYFLSQHFDFDGVMLSQAIANTFQRRRTVIPELPIAFTAAFAQDDAKQKQWAAFLRRTSPHDMPASFELVVDGIALFLKPVLTCLADNQPFTQQWHAADSWHG